MGITDVQFGMIPKPIKSGTYCRQVCYKCQAGIPNAWLMYCHERPCPFPVRSEAKHRVYLHLTDGEGRYPADLNEEDLLCDRCYVEFD